jgi:CRP-like cAMP-binding protein
MSDPRAAALIQQSGFLSAMPRPAAEQLAACARSRTLRGGEYAGRPGDPLPLVGWLHRGLIYAYFELSDGSRLPYLIAWPNDVAFQGLAEEDGFAVSLLALAPTTYFVVPPESARAITEAHPGLTEALLRYAVRREHARAVWTGHVLSLPLRPRLRLILARMAAELGKRRAEGCLLDFPVTRQALAAVARASRDEIGRALRELDEAGSVQRIAGRKLLIPDSRGLLGPDLGESAARLGILPEAGGGKGEERTGEPRRTTRPGTSRT